MRDPFSKLAGDPAEIFGRLLDASGVLLVSERSEELGLPDDELHREILGPLLPAMLGDAALREFWLGQGTGGFFGRLGAYLRGEGARPSWEAGDFEIHVAASYRAGADARALADTLLSEESLRGLTAGVMNRVLEVVWEELPADDVARQGEVVAGGERETVVAREAANWRTEDWKQMAESDEGRASGVLGEGFGCRRIELGRPKTRGGARVLVTWRAWARWPKWKRSAWWKKHAAGLADGGGRKLRPLGWMIRVGEQAFD